MSKNRNRLAALASAGMLGIEMPADSGYDLRPLHGVPVWLWASGRDSPWLAAIGPLLRQANPSVLRLHYAGIAWEDIPLERPEVEDQDRQPPAAIPLVPPTPFHADLYGRLARGEKPEPRVVRQPQQEQKPWWEEHVDDEEQ